MRRWVLTSVLGPNAIAEIDPSTQILALFPKQRDPAGIPYIGNALGKPFTPSELLTKVRRAIAAYGPGKRPH